jgi:hypothetical protein
MFTAHHFTRPLLQGRVAAFRQTTHVHCAFFLVRCRSNGRGPELTPAALEAHNKSHSSMSLTSHGSARSLDCSALANMPQLAPSAAYLARMAKVRPGWSRVVGCFWGWIGVEHCLSAGLVSS